MKIEQSDVSLASQHSYLKEVSRTETLRAWVGDRRPDFEASGTAAQAAAPSAKVAISDAARLAVAAVLEQPEEGLENRQQPGEVDAANLVSDDTLNDPKLNLLIRIVEALSGRKVVLMDPREIGNLASADMQPAHIANHPGGESRPQGWGLEYDFHEEIYEAEQTSFTAGGEIVTADGRRLQFDLTLQMSREFHQETSVSFRVGDAVRKDPLIINFDGNAAELSGAKFDFDIDADGQADHISFVGAASGFLALDRNGNGRIDDGTELFGARTGDGFAELAAYDSDGNGWIDQNDSIFAALRIWTKDSSGADRLSSLAERDIGALYLGQTATPFDLKDERNTQHGQILSSGVYLTESGGAGTIQQLDLFV